MVIFEEGRNLPSKLGIRNLPPEKSWGLGKVIASLPSVVGIINDRTILPQLRGVVFPGGSIDGPIIGQVAGKLRERLMLFRQTEKNIPLPWGPRTWPEGSVIGTLASVIQTGGGVTGPTRTMHPQFIGYKPGVAEDVYLSVQI
jgi:hypothetical protein